MFDFFHAKFKKIIYENLLKLNKHIQKKQKNVSLYLPINYMND